MTKAFIGTAGSAIPRAHAHEFAAEGSSLQRYAGRFGGMEINSSFHRPHRPATYAGWAAAVPPAFRFAVKVPKLITHQHKLHDAAEPLDRFLAEARELGLRLGPLLVQLPPSLQFETGLAEAFFSLLRTRHAGAVACEPRHLSWFADDAGDLLSSFHVARVAADPAIAPAAGLPGGWGGLVYHRLHGSPRRYYDAYSHDYLVALATTLKPAVEQGVPVWCMFDNTVTGAASGNALQLTELMLQQDTPGGW